MSNTAELLQQRAIGHVKIHMGGGGVERIREQGSLKVRIPPGSREAIIINTAGGLAGGDSLSLQAIARRGSTLTLTTQAAERVYRTLGPPARVATSLTLEEGATLLWLPHETILFDQASLHRSLAIEMAAGASFIGLESAVYGRTAMNEKLNHLSHRDDWRITRQGKLLHAEAWKLDGALPSSPAALGHNHAIATLVIVAPDSERHLAPLRAALGEQGSTSAWNGKLVARVMAKDGFTLKKRLASALVAVVGTAALPKLWSL